MTCIGQKLGMKEKLSCVSFADMVGMYATDSDSSISWSIPLLKVITT